MKAFRDKYRSNVYSQFGEDGLIAEIIKRIKLPIGTAVEFGGHNGTFCSNTAHLRDQGWKVFMYDMEHQNSYVERRKITIDNVNQLPLCQVLSIDCDNPDYHIWKAYTGQPDIVIIEVNSSLPPHVEEIPGDWGASYLSMLKLGISKGYFLVAHTGNCLFVLNKYRSLFQEITEDGISNADQYFDTQHLQK